MAQSKDTKRNSLTADDICDALNLEGEVARVDQQKQAVIMGWGINITLRLDGTYTIEGLPQG